MGLAEVNDELAKTGGPIIKLAAPGEEVAFTVIDGEFRQKTDIKTQALLTFPDGRPKNQLVLTVQRDGVTEEERVFMHWAAEKSLKVWLAAKKEKLGPGSRIVLRREADTPPKVRGEDPAQNYSVKHKPAPILNESDF